MTQQKITGQRQLSECKPCHNITFDGSDAEFTIFKKQHSDLDESLITLYMMGPDDSQVNEIPVPADEVYNLRCHLIQFHEDSESDITVEVTGFTHLSM